MSILQIEVSDETRARIDAWAKSDERDVQELLAEAVEKAIRLRQEQEEKQKRYIESELLKALESGPGEVADDAWWEQLEADVLADTEGKKA